VSEASLRGKRLVFIIIAFCTGTACSWWGLDAPEFEEVGSLPDRPNPASFDGTIDAVHSREPCRNIDTTEQVACLEASCTSSRTCLPEGWSEPSACACPGWRKMAAAPPSFVGRRYAATAWTGDEVLIWGGVGADGALADGAAYQPRSNTWRSLPRAPLSPRSGMAFAWTGLEFILWSGEHVREGRIKPAEDGAAYNPKTNQWRMLANANIAGRSDAFSSYQRSAAGVVIWGGLLESGFARDGAVYLPSEDRFQPLAFPPSQVQARVPWGAAAGDEVMFLKGRCKQLCNDAFVLAAAANTWRTVEPPNSSALEFNEWDDFQYRSCSGSPSKALFWGGIKNQLGEGELSNKMTGVIYTKPSGFEVVPEPPTTVPNAQYQAFCSAQRIGLLAGFQVDQASAQPVRFVDVFATYENDLWQMREASGLSPRALPYVIPFGDEVLVWGGWNQTNNELLVDGSVYKFAETQ
jgi:hypothetical protein